MQRNDVKEIFHKKLAICFDTSKIENANCCELALALAPSAQKEPFKKLLPCKSSKKSLRRIQAKGYHCFSVMLPVEGDLRIVSVL